MKLYVGNLPRSFTNIDLKKLFNEVGDVSRATIMTDRKSGHSFCFGFVNMDHESGQQAIQKLNKRIINNRTLRVNEVELPNFLPMK